MADDFTQPSNDGGKIPNELDKDEPLVHVAYRPDLHLPAFPSIPGELACSRTYVLSIDWSSSPVTNKAAACGGGYESALQFLLERAQHFKCPQQCGPIHTWVMRRSWWFHGAEVSGAIWIGMLCPKAADVKPSGLGKPAEEDFGESNPKEDDDTFLELIHGRAHWSVRNPQQFIACNRDRKLIEFVYVDDVRACSTVDYATIVPVARKEAAIYAEHVKCAHATVTTAEGTQRVECERKAGRVRTEWSCDAENRQVRVEVYWVIRCIPPKP